MGKNRRPVVTCREFNIQYEADQVSYRLDSRFQQGGDKALQQEQRVTLRVQRRKGRNKLVNCVVRTQINACDCGACDFDVYYVAVPVQFADQVPAISDAEVSAAFSRWQARAHLAR